MKIKHYLKDSLKISFLLKYETVQNLKNIELLGFREIICIISKEKNIIQQLIHEF
jgi:hypothetical protein